MVDHIGTFLRLPGMQSLCKFAFGMLRVAGLWARHMLFTPRYLVKTKEIILVLLARELMRPSKNRGPRSHYGNIEAWYAITLSSPPGLRVWCFNFYRVIKAIGHRKNQMEIYRTLGNEYFFLIDWGLWEWKIRTVWSVRRSETSKPHLPHVIS